MENEFEINGSYEPGFIHIRINTDEDLYDLNKLIGDHNIPNYLSTFFHEYIHFLQDITSTYGLMNFIHVVETLKNGSCKIRAGVSPQIGISLLDNTFNLETNIDFKRIYIGDDIEVKEIRYLDYKSSQEKITSNTGEQITIPKYTIHYNNHDKRRPEDFHFGVRCIKEYMAHAIQKQLFPETKHGDIPYIIVEQILQKEYPLIGNNTAFIIAFCDASLMSYHPAQFFFDMLEQMKKEEWNPIDEDSIYQFAYMRSKFPVNGKDENLLSLFEKKNTMAVECFKNCLQGDIFKDNVTWFEEIMKEAKDLRMNQNGFFTKLVSAPGVPSDLFFEIFKRLGTPFMTNAKSKGFFLPPEKLKTLNITAYYPKVFEAIMGTFYGNKGCSLYKICDTREEKFTNQLCTTEPWKRLEGCADLCPYGQLWRTWGLENAIL